MKKLLVFVLCCALCAAVFCCGKKREKVPKQEGAPPAGTIAEVISGDGRFSTLAAAIEAAELAGTLAGEGPFTLFAPPDSVFAKLPPGTAESLLQDAPVLRNILLYHVVQGKLPVADLGGIPSLVTLLSEPVSLARAPGGGITIGGAAVVASSIEAKNGVIHMIDKVLLPPEKPAD